MSFVDSDGVEYLKSSTEQVINSDILNIVFDIDITQTSNHFIFDNKGLNLKLDLLDDSLTIPINASTLAVLSELSDRTNQINDQSILHLTMKIMLCKWVNR